MNQDTIFKALLIIVSITTYLHIGAIYKRLDALEKEKKDKQ